MTITFHTIAPSRQLPAYAPPPIDPPPLGREAPTLERNNHNRIEGDKSLAWVYGQALRSGLGNHDEAMLENIPPNSTFGQWWTQLSRAMQSQGIADWLRDHQVDLGTVKINPESGEISFKVKRHITANPVVQTYGPDNPGWAAVSGPVMEAGKVIAANYRFYTFKPPLTDDSHSAPLLLVQRFYKEKSETSQTAIQQRESEWVRNRFFVDPPNKDFSSLHEARSEKALDAQKAVLGNNNTRFNAALSLQHLLTLMKGDEDADTRVHGFLTTSKVNVDPYSTFPAGKLNQWQEISLLHYIEEMGWDVPTDQASVENLLAALLSPEPQQRPFGNYGGALKGPIPLDTSGQRQLRRCIRQGKLGDVDLSPFKNVLEYLMHGTPFKPSELRHPQRLLDQLIQSPRGQMLGTALQARLDEKPAQRSLDDWLSAALSLDQDDPLRALPDGENTYVAGFALTESESYGQSSAVIVERLVNHLVTTARASSPEIARVQAHLLLSTRAPELLVKDVPDKVTLGSHSWVSFFTAVQRLEAKAPGCTAAMTYAQVMLKADIAPISPLERHTEYLAQEEALKVWGVANGLPMPLTAASMNTIRQAFSAQVNELKAAAGAQSAQIPVAREMAMEQLKNALPDMDPVLFDKKCITLEPSIAYLPGPYSVLDLYLDGRSANGAPTAQTDGFYQLFFPLSRTPSPSQFVSSSEDVQMTKIIDTLKSLPRVSINFKQDFSDYCDSMEKSIATQVKYLIAQQPLKVRKNLEFGTIEVIREDRLTYSAFSGEPSVKSRDHSNLLIKTRRNGQVHTYEVDLKKGLLFERTDGAELQKGQFPPNTNRPSSDFVEVIPEGQYSDGLTHESHASAAIPDSFNNERTSYIANAFVKHANLRALKDEAMGLTTFDTEVPFYRKMTEFMLNLIPLRSAIVNFKNGDIGAGIVDLSLDVFGFVIGAGAAAQGTKAFSSGVSTFNKVLRGGKIIGRAAIGSLNPLDGLTDFAKGLYQLGRNGLKSAGVLRTGSKAGDISPPRSPVPLSNEKLKQNWERLHARPQNRGLICYEASLRVGQAEKALSPNVFDVVKATTDRRGASNYSPRYLDIMGITPDRLKTTFRPAEIAESGLINFKHANEGGVFGHTVYIQKADNNDLFLFNTNSPDLDLAMIRNGNLPHISGGMTVYSLGNGKHKGLQDFLDGLDGKAAWQFAYTPASRLDANVQKARAVTR